MKRIINFLLCLFFLCPLFSDAQINYTAQDTVPTYNDPFLFGSNLGYYTPWDDKQLADIAAGDKTKRIPGVGVNSLRPTLPHKFLKRWGLDNKIDEFEYYTSLGIINNTVFIGYPDDEVRDWNRYSNCDEPSQLFKKMYEDIWIDEGNGSVRINDNNHYAKYVWDVVNLYKDHVKFWEIWNEPDLAHSDKAWRPPGDPNGNWWDENPDPCDYKIKAPIMHYVRMLRISYEVIKFIDPEAYVAIGGLGYPSFLDAVMRNTDNPNGGGVTADYPLGGGAYFDVMSYHSYPHIDGSLREWNNDIRDFDYYRHSDAAVDGLIAKQDEFKTVLENYGYNGRTYPEKIYIVTETNIPRREFDDYIGSSEAQRNYLMKAVVMAQQNDIEQLCVYDLGEKEKDWQASGSFDLMGLYESLEHDGPYEQQETDAGYAYKTTSDLLKNHIYDPTQTELLGLPEEIRGGAFRNKFTNQHTYILWAKTDRDRDETASARYDFPEGLELGDLRRFQWNISETGIFDTIPDTQIELDGTPVFLRPTRIVILPVELIAFRGYRDNADAILEWVTASEENNYEFIIEHSADGRSFEVIGSLPGAGTTSETQYYNFKHHRAIRGTNYYRLKQVDLDGTFTYSDVVVVEIESSDLFTVRPTQADTEIHIEFYDYYDKDIDLAIYDVLGRARMDAILPAGRNALSIDVRGLGSGHYFIRMKVRGEDYFTRRFVKAKL